MPRVIGAMYNSVAGGKEDCKKGPKESEKGGSEGRGVVLFPKQMGG